MLHYVQHDKMIGDQKLSDSLPFTLLYTCHAKRLSDRDLQKSQ